jgi:hypothetical protein
MFLNDGYQALVRVSVGAGLTVVLIEREVQPPSLEVGSIDTDTMRNGVGSVQAPGGLGGAFTSTGANYRTKQPKSKVTVGDMTMQCQYDPATYIAIRVGIIGKIGTIRVTFPDGSYTEFQGWVDSFTPQALKEGEFPLAEVKIIPSMQNEGATGVALMGSVNQNGTSGQF